MKSSNIHLSGRFVTKRERRRRAAGRLLYCCIAAVVVGYLVALALDRLFADALRRIGEARGNLALSIAEARADKLEREGVVSE